MGSTVYANGLAVATSTSGHWARSLPGDLRKVNMQVPTLLPNNVQSKNIYAGFPTLTKFASGLIWVEGTKAGPKSMPIDCWPGVVVGSAINSYATSKPGSGSNNVFAEAKRVYCFTHGTLQNEGNSMGILDDKPGVVIGNNDGDGEGDGLGLLDGDDGSASKGGARGEGGKSDQSDPAKKKDQTGPKPTEPCTVLKAVVHDKVPVRDQSEEKNETAYLQIVSKTTIVFEGEVHEPCTTDHPLWNIDGKDYKELKVEQSPTHDTAHSIFSQHVALWDMLRVANTDPAVLTAMFKAHHGTKTRIVHVFPKAETKGQKVELIKGATEKVKALSKWLTAKMSWLDGVKIKLVTLDVVVDVAWEPDKITKWRCQLAIGLKLSSTLFELALKKYFDLTFLTAIPVVGQILAALYAVNAAIRAWNEKIVGNVAELISWIPFWGDDWAEKAKNWTLPSIPLPQAYVDFKFTISASIGCKFGKVHAITPYASDEDKSWHFFDGKNQELGKLGGSLALAFGLCLGNDKTLFEAGGEVKGEATYEAKLTMWAIGGSLKPVTITGKLYFNYDLLRLVPWVATQDERAKLSKTLSKFGLNPVGKLEKPLFSWVVWDGGKCPEPEWKFG